jgi:hypothetical protein
MGDFFVRRRVGAGLLLLLLFLGASSTESSEPTGEFLDALRQQGYFEQADDYIEWLKDSNLADDSLRQASEYFIAETAIKRAAAAKDPKVREKLSAEATARLAKFLESHPDHPLALEAESRLASSLLEQATSQITAAQALPAKDRESKLISARGDVAEAKKRIATALEHCAAQLATTSRNQAAEDPKLKTRRQQLISQEAQLKLLSARCEFDLGRTYVGDAKNSEAHFLTAAKQYAGLFEEYRRIAAGMYAHLQEGRSYQELGKFRQAIGCFQDVLKSSEDDAELRPLQAQAILHLLESLSHIDEKKYADASQRGDTWLKSLPASSTPDADVLAIHYLTAQASYLAAQELPETDASKRHLLSLAKTHAAAAANRPGQYQKSAKTLLTKFGGKKNDDQPKTFAEAFGQGRDAFAKAQEAAAGLKVLAEDPKSANADEEAKLKKEKQAQSDIAEGFLQTALDLVDPKSPAEEVQATRFYLCLLAWERGGYADAVRLGKPLMQDKDSAQSRQAARIVMWSLVRLYNDAKGDQRTDKGAEIVSTAEAIAANWPNQEEGGEATTLLITFALQDQNLERAQGYLDKVAKDSSSWAQAALPLGQAYWRKAIASQALPVESRPSPEQIAQWKTKGETLLKQGVDTLLPQHEATPALVEGMASLAQLYLDNAQQNEAIALLEEPQVGLLKLLRDNHPTTKRPGYAMALQQLALRAYVTCHPPRITEAQTAMAALETLAGKTDDPKTAQNLTQVYVVLGRELQQQLQSLKEKNKPKEMSAVAEGFEMFLSKVAEHDQGKNFATTSWVAETFYNLAVGFDEARDAAGKLNPSATKYYQKAAAAYQSIIEEVDKNPSFVPAGVSVSGIRLRMAICFRRLGMFNDATKAILVVLKDKPANLTAQLQGAEVYQARGELEPRYFAFAIEGAEDDLKTKEKRVWGWAKLAKMTMSNPKQDPQFDEIFYEARLKLSTARYQLGLSLTNPQKRKQMLEDAETEVKRTYYFRTTLGGPTWYPKFNRLLKEIQDALGVKSTGIDGLPPVEKEG